MATTSKGRGYAINSISKNSAHTLRRPGEESLKQRYGTSSTLLANSGQNQTSNEPVLKDKISELCDKIGNISMTNPESNLCECSQQLMLLCDTPDTMDKCLEGLLQFALKTKWNCHAFAILSHCNGDHTAGSSKFRSLLLSKLQVFYNGRNKSYLDIDKFLMEVTLMCEVFHHVLIRQSCIVILAKAVLDYLGILLDGSSQKEIEVFVEQFPKCYKNLKECSSNELNALLVKVRKQIICDSTTVTCKAMLMEVFESVLTDWKPMDHYAKQLYSSFSKPIIRICE